MRLPAITARQQQQEDARVFHESLWCAFLEQQKIRVLPGPEGVKVKQARVSGNLRRFWNERGYLLKTKRAAQSLEVWIEPMPSTIHLGTRRRRCVA